MTNQPAGELRQRCESCKRPFRDARLCWTCTDRLERRIAELPALDRELEIAETRQTALGPTSEGRAAETAVVFNPGAAVVRLEFTATIVAWAKDWHTFTGPPTVEGCSRVLLRSVPKIRQHETAAQLFDEIDYCSRRAWSAIDLPADRTRVKVSDCLTVGCPGELWAHIPVEEYNPDDPGTHATIGCDQCDTVYPTGQWYHLGKRILAHLAAA